MPPNEADNDKTTDTRATTEEATNSTVGGATSLIPFIAGVALLGLAALGGITWFMVTEPAKPSTPQITPSATDTATSANTLGFRGDTRSPSEIIRAARRAQERLDEAATAP